MRIVIIEHARKRMRQRGVTDDEARLVLETGQSADAELGRKSKDGVFEFSGLWQGRSYPQKKVQVIYREEGENVVVITVYAFYGRWQS